MCDPLTIGLTSLAVGVAGTGLGAYQQNAAVQAQQSANNKAAKRSRDARLAEIARQQEIQKQQLGIIDEKTTEIGAQNQIADIDQQAAENTADYLSAANAPDYNVTPVGLGNGETEGNKVFNEMAARSISEQAAKTREQIAALAKLSAYGQVNTDNRVSLGRAGQELGMLGGFAKGSLDVSNLEQNIPARQVGQPDMTLAAILAGGGQLGTNYAGFQMGKSPTYNSI